MPELLPRRLQLTLQRRVALQEGNHMIGGFAVVQSLADRRVGKHHEKHIVFALSLDDKDNNVGCPRLRGNLL